MALATLIASSRLFFGNVQGFFFAVAVGLGFLTRCGFAAFSEVAV